MADEMTKRERERRRLLALYGALYKGHEYERMPGSMGCFYCGDSAGTRDHCPPLSWVETKKPARWRADGVHLLLVPACDDCNRRLGDRALFTPLERAEYVRSKLESIYDRQHTMWADDEIAEMGPEFQRTIKARRLQLVALLGRVRAAQWRCVREAAAEFDR